MAYESKSVELPAIDDELTGLSPTTCFTLGVEWSMFRRLLITRSDTPFTVTVLRSNAKRLTSMAEQYGRYVEYHQQCKDWVEIVVGGQKE